MKNPPIQGFMLVKCSDPNHVGCTSIKNQIKKLDHVYESYKTRFVEDGELFCIAVKAKARRNEFKTLEGSILGISDMKHHVSVANIRSYHA